MKTKTMEFLNNKDYKGLFLYAKEDVDRFYDEIDCDKYEGFERSKCIWLKEVLEEGISERYEDEIFEIDDSDYFARKVEEHFKELERAIKGYEEFKLETGNYISLKIPYEWAYAVANDDYTGLEDGEEKEVEEMLKKIKKMSKGKPYFISWIPEEEKYFSPCPDFTKKACDVVDLKLILLEE